MVIAIVILNVSIFDCEHHPLHLPSATRNILLRGATTSSSNFATGVPDYLRSPPFDASMLSHCDHVVVVCGHAITVVEALDRVESSDTAWSLLPYQRDQDLPAAFVSHIKKGVEVAAADPRSLLVFSGGQTRPTAGPRSEAMSYWMVAEHFGWWNSAAQVDRWVVWVLMVPSVPLYFRLDRISSLIFLRSTTTKP
jgi:hypothetical protein